MNKAYLTGTLSEFYIAKHLKKIENTSLAVELQSWIIGSKGYVYKNLLGMSS